MRDSLFAADSPLMRVLGRVADLVVLNVLFLVSSLPLVTLGASLTALHSTAMRLVRGTCESVVADYRSAFRAHLRPGGALLAALLGVAAVLAGWYVVVTSVVTSPTAQLVLLAVWFVLAAQLAVTALFAFPYLATFDDPVRVVLRNARLLSWRHPLATLTVLTTTLLPVVITVFYPQLTVYGLLWAVLGFAAVAVVSGMVHVRVVDRYGTRPDGAADREGAAAGAHA